LLNYEFGWFKKDTSLNETTNEKPKDSGLQIEWEEDDSDDGSGKSDDGSKKKEEKKPKTIEPKKEKKGLGKFIDKIAQPDEEEFEENDDF
jgi:hypothetical protein